MRRPMEPSRLPLLGSIVVQEGVVARRVTGGGQLNPVAQPDAIGAQEAVPALGTLSITIEVRVRRHLLIDGAREWQVELVVPGEGLSVAAHVIEARTGVPLIQYADDAVGLVADLQRLIDAVFP